MIRFLLLQNRQGKTRLAKYYVPLQDSEKHKIEYGIVFFTVYLILDEFILAGELQETSKKAIIERMGGELDKLE